MPVPGPARGAWPNVSWAAALPGGGAAPEDDAITAGPLVGGGYVVVLAPAYVASLRAATGAVGWSVALDGAGAGACLLTTADGGVVVGVSNAPATLGGAPSSFAPYPHWPLIGLSPLNGSVLWSVPRTDGATAESLACPTLAGTALTWAGVDAAGVPFIDTMDLSALVRMGRVQVMGHVGIDLPLGPPALSMLPPPDASPVSAVLGWCGASHARVSRSAVADDLHSWWTPWNVTDPDSATDGNQKGCPVAWAVDGSGAAFAAAAGGWVFAMDLGWAALVGAPVVGIALASTGAAPGAPAHTMFVTAGGALTALNATTGAVLWVDACAGARSPPTVDARGDVFVGAAGGAVGAWRGDTGAPLWRVSAGSAAGAAGAPDVITAPVIGTGGTVIVAVGTTVVVLAADGSRGVGVALAASRPTTCGTAPVVTAAAAATPVASVAGGAVAAVVAVAAVAVAGCWATAAARRRRRGALHKGGQSVAPMAVANPLATAAAAAAASSSLQSAVADSAHIDASGSAATISYVNPMRDTPAAAPPRSDAAPPTAASVIDGLATPPQPAAAAVAPAGDASTVTVPAAEAGDSDPAVVPSPSAAAPRSRSTPRSGWRSATPAARRPATVNAPSSEDLEYQYFGTTRVAKRRQSGGGK